MYSVISVVNLVKVITCVWLKQICCNAQRHTQVYYQRKQKMVIASVWTIDRRLDHSFSLDLSLERVSLIHDSRWQQRLVRSCSCRVSSNGIDHFTLQKYADTNSGLI